MRGWQLVVVALLGALGEGQFAARSGARPVKPRVSERIAVPVALIALGAACGACNQGVKEYLESGDIEKVARDIQLRCPIGGLLRLFRGIACGGGAIQSVTGDAVTFEVLRDRRNDWSSAPSDGRSTSFWCGGGGEPAPTSGFLAKCFRTMGDDPPATLDKVEERGTRGSLIGTTGYALFLTVKHPGILGIGIDLDCTRNVYGQSYAESPTWEVLTILAP